MTVIDAQQRELALDVGQSFIVQAPAGSGKTGVLTQRILKLLTIVDRPEQILAITFTKKAAAEMRTRVAEALQMASAGVAPESPHEKTYFDLASAALARDKLQNWRLLENLGRLRLLTIDSLCSSLVKENPLTAGLGAQFGVEDDASELYADATRNLLAMLDDDGDIADALFRVLRHFENQYGKLHALITQMLEQRDHWLRDVTHAQQNWDNFKTLLTASLKTINAEAEQRIHDALTPSQRAELDALTIYAINQLHLEKTDHPILAADAGSLDFRKQQLNLFITKGPPQGWRKRLDKTIGFPAPKSGPEKKEADQFKARAKELLEAFDRGGDAFLNDVIEFIQAPKPELSAAEWQLLEDLVLVVRYAAAHLKLVFNQRRSVDFSEVALAALLALGADEKPTDAMLSLDERIAHILVDEFQDTSFIQVELLEKLTEGWVAGDGRSLFLVGDPMQSIYAFRKADVGLFLKLWQQRQLGHIPLQTLQLCMNFRSSPVVLNWINDSFSKVFPRQDDIRAGAVSYAVSHAGKIASVTDQTETHLFVGPDADALVVAEADWIANQIHALPTDASVAILVKGKSHIYAIATAMRARNIGFQAVDIENLADTQIIIDLLSLYQVCVSPGNKVAWFSLLRGPWCGLTLQELEQVANVDSHPWRAVQLLCSRPDVLSAETVQKLQLIEKSVSYFYQHRLQLPFAELLHELALKTGMAATARSVADIEAMELFFQLLANVDDVGGYPDQTVLQKKLSRLFVPPEPIKEGQASVQVMTMHKSKGLEFDVVFLPQLHRKSRRDDKPLILVDKQTALLDQAQELFMAPATSGSNNVYDYLWKIRQKRTANETVRLLYVACTRARKRLLLTGCLKQEDNLRKPDPSSLLSSIWPVVETSAVQHDIEPRETVFATAGFRRPSRPLTELQLQTEHAAATVSATSNSTTDATESSAPDIHRAAGILLHKILENWGRYPQCIPQTLSKPMQQHWQQQLQRAGLDVDACEQAAEWIRHALQNMLDNPQRKYWLLEQPHQGAQVEYPVTSIGADGLEHWIIDRTFIDNGIRHIIDYKLVKPAGDVATFLAEETARYAPQLKTYRDVLSAQDSIPCRTYLYFPLIDHLQEVET